MVLLRLFISLFPLFLFAYKYRFYSDINLYSNELYFDVFSKKWENIPSYKSLNRVIDFSKVGFEYKDYGIKYESDGILKVNRGFVETWYYASEDFNTLLKRSDIGYYIDTPEIYGVLNYAEYYSVYYKKRFKNLTFYFNLLKGKKLDYIYVNGINTKDRFLADLIYVYSDKNFITKEFDAKDATAFGGGVDIEFKYKNKENLIFFGVYNVFGFLKWSGVNYMYYHFDSNTTYVGEDGYLHQKPFGEGYYKFGTTFFQKLPMFFRYDLVYNLKKFNIGFSGIFSSGNFFNMPFLEKKIKSVFIKVGYILNSKSLVFGFRKNNLKVEVSKNLKLHSKAVKVLFDIKF